MPERRVTLSNPKAVPAPVGAYSHVAVVEAGPIAFVSGQVGVGPDGQVPADLAEEARLVWKNVVAAVEGAGGSVQSIIKMTLLVAQGADLAPLRQARQAALGEHRPASTLMVVAALAEPRFHYEVEVVAAVP
jgi:enamine deaminase RidA (YjgF/YER057c/UK114 family)